MGIIAALIIGGIAGWLAGLIVRGAGFGLIGNIVIGIIGALLASWLLPQLGVQPRRGLGSRHHQRHHRRGDHPGDPVADQTLTKTLPIPIATAGPAVVYCSGRERPKNDNKARATRQTDR